MSVRPSVHPRVLALIASLVVAAGLLAGVIFGLRGSSRPAADSVAPSTTAPSTTAHSTVALSTAKPSTTAPSTTAPAPTSSSMPPGISLAPTVAATTASPVSIKAVANFGGDVNAKVIKFQYGTVTDQGPGIISGVPEVTFTVQVTNGSAGPVDAGNVEVTAAYGSDLTPAAPANQSTTDPITGSLAPGAAAAGTYAFAIPTDQQRNVTLTVWIDPNRPTVVLTGSSR